MTLEYLHVYHVVLSTLTTIHQLRGGTNECNGRRIWSQTKRSQKQTLASIPGVEEQKGRSRKPILCEVLC